MGIIQRLDEKYIEEVQKMAKNGFWHYDLAKKKLTASPIIFEIHEIPVAETLDFDTAINYFIPSHKIELLRAYTKLIEQGVPYDLELIAIVPGDREKYIRTTAVPVKKNGRVIEVVGMYQDITKSKQIDIEGERAKLRLKLSLAATHTGVWDWDSTHDNLFWDETMFEIFEFPKDEFPGNISVFERIVHPLDKENFYKSIEESLEAKKDYITTFRVITPKGNIKHIAARGKVDSSKFDGKWFTGINWDISHEIKQKEIIDAQEAKIVASSRLSSLGEMAGGVAHEINNPLSIIQGQAESLIRKLGREQSGREDLIEGLATIERTCGRIVNIVKGLKTFSRDSEKDPFIKLSLGKVIEDVLCLTQEKLKTRAVELRIGNFNNIEIFGRPAQLGQVIMNLLSNSLDAIGKLEEKWISIKPILKETLVDIEFCDSGHGINPEIEDKIMQPFFTTKEVGEGIGLGLSISKGIIEDHNGRLWLNQLSKNTCFIVELPLAL